MAALGPISIVESGPGSAAGMSTNGQKRTNPEWCKALVNIRASEKNASRTPYRWLCHTGSERRSLINSVRQSSMTSVTIAKDG